MADDAEDVLELDEELELDVIDDEDEPEAKQTNGDPAEDDGEDDISFGEEGAAPAQESESSVIRDLRKANRELAKTVSQLQRGSRPQAIDPGPKPTLEACGYDEEVFEAQLDDWKTRKAQAEQVAQAEQERAEAERQSWEGIKTAYEADKGSLKVGNYAEAEDEVFSALSEQHQALLMKSGKGAQLVVALSRTPDKLEELSKMNLADAAMMIGELRGKLQMTKRSTATPERRVTGNAGFSGGTDKQLAKLKAKAEQSGDYSEYFAAKRAAKA